MFFIEANRSKIFQITDRATFYIFPAVLMFCKVNIMLFSSLLDMITASLCRWVGGMWVGGSMGKWSVVGWPVVGGFNKTRYLILIC